MLLKRVDYVLDLIFLLSKIIDYLFAYYSLVHKFWCVVYSVKFVEMLKLCKFANDIIRLYHYTDVMSFAEHVFIQKLKIV